MVSIWGAKIPKILDGPNSPGLDFTAEGMRSPQLLAAPANDSEVRMTQAGVDRNGTSNFYGRLGTPESV